LRAGIYEIAVVCVANCAIKSRIQSLHERVSLAEHLYEKGCRVFNLVCENASAHQNALIIGHIRGCVHHGSDQLSRICGSLEKLGNSSRVICDFGVQIGCFVLSDPVVEYLFLVVLSATRVSDKRTEIKAEI